MCWEKPLHNNQQFLHQPRQLIHSLHVTEEILVASDRHMLRRQLRSLFAYLLNGKEFYPGRSYDLGTPSFARDFKIGAARRGVWGKTADDLIVLCECSINLE